MTTVVIKEKNLDDDFENKKMIKTLTNFEGYESAKLCNVKRLVLLMGF